MDRTNSTASGKRNAPLGFTVAPLGRLRRWRRVPTVSLAIAAVGETPQPGRERALDVWIVGRWLRIGRLWVRWRSVRRVAIRLEIIPRLPVPIQHCPCAEWFDSLALMVPFAPLFPAQQAVETPCRWVTLSDCVEIIVEIDDAKPSRFPGALCRDPTGQPAQARGNKRASELCAVGFG